MGVNNELVLVCTEIGTRDFLPKEQLDRQFREVSDWLWSKYGDQISDFAKTNLRGMEKASRDRAPLRFDYVDAGGSQVPIDHAEEVSNIATVAKQVQWHPQVVGGTSFRQAFGQHALEILSNPRYRNWQTLADGKPGYGIRAVGPDKDGVIRTLTITPSPTYPSSPPLVVSEPPFTNDVCWSDGTLHYTRYADGGGSPWTEIASRSTNPLLVILIELLQKYKWGV